MNDNAAKTAAERVAALNRAVDTIRDGLTEAQLDELEWAMNYEYIADADDAE